MIWKPKCARYRLLLALEAGHDLDEQDHAELGRHVAQCPACREYRNQVQAGYRALEQAGRAGCSPDTGPSLWPGVKVALSVRQPGAPRELWVGWVPAVALAAACMFLIYIVHTGPSFDEPPRSLRPRQIQSAFEPFAEVAPQNVPGSVSDLPPSMRPVPHWVSDGGWNTPLEPVRRLPTYSTDPRSF